MGSKPLIQVGGNTYVALVRNNETFEKIDILHEGAPLRQGFREQPS
jgi:hypothetical protein